MARRNPKGFGIALFCVAVVMILTADEVAFLASWSGHVAVVESCEDALKIVGGM